jgi:uncharacterized protein
MHADLDRLAAGKYVLLTTFRKDGTPVPTPVWAVSDADELLVWTVTDSGKVKRIRRDGTVEVGPCDVRGKPAGPAVHGQAKLLDSARTEQVRRMIMGKYGLFGRLVVRTSQLRRGKDGTIGVAITLD